jgi:peptidyl-tRNA hydrolase, PTH1 family
MGNIKLIVGLGNPGKRYVKTRHNAGFNVLDLLAGQWGSGWKNWKDQADISVKVSGEKVILAKPSLFMNISGVPIRSLLDYYDIAPDEMLIINDDFSLKLGVLRLRLSGSSGGHNGIESIIVETGTSLFPRLKLGIGPVPPGIDPADFVLSEFKPEENSIMQETYKKAVTLLEDALSYGVETAVSKFPGADISLKPQKDTAKEQEK